MRGNTYSRAHATLDPDDDFKYWRFSFDHIAKYDLPAAFNYVASRTGQQKLFYVGHSLGTTVGFAGFSKYPELAARVKVFAALAPVAKVANIRGVMAILAPFADLISVCLALEMHVKAPDTSDPRGVTMRAGRDGNAGPRRVHS